MNEEREKEEKKKNKNNNKVMSLLGYNFGVLDLRKDIANFQHVSCDVSLLPLDFSHAHFGVFEIHVSPRLIIGGQFISI